MLPCPEIIGAPQKWQDQPLVNKYIFIFFFFFLLDNTSRAHLWFDGIQRTFGLTFMFLENIYYRRPYKYKLMWSPVEKTHEIMSPLNNTKGIPEHKYKDILVLCFLFYENNLVFPCPSSQTCLVWYWEKNHTLSECLTVCFRHYIWKQIIRSKEIDI